MKAKIVGLEQDYPYENNEGKMLIEAKIDDLERWKELWLRQSIIDINVEVEGQRSEMEDTEEQPESDSSEYLTDIDGDLSEEDIDKTQEELDSYANNKNDVSEETQVEIEEPDLVSFDEKDAEAEIEGREESEKAETD